MRLAEHDVIKFDGFMPIYNWIYPLGGHLSKRFVGESASDVFSAVTQSKSRALYLHIPFCETVCSFCPFVRGKYRGESIVDAYVDALCREISIKGQFKSLCGATIGAIFFGGGTPSILTPTQIRKIGRALRDHFNLADVLEYSFEFELKSIAQDKVDALLEIGATHARFGLQTFSPEFRTLFDLTATIDDIYNGVEILSNSFTYTSCDILYGMNGQTEEQLLSDIQQVCSLKLNNTDFYPINNLATQTKLHQKFRQAGTPPVTGLTKFYMRLMLRQALKENGFLPHNGHGWVRVSDDEIRVDPVVTESYSFVYHEHVLGYSDYDLLGFGTNAISSFAGFVVCNAASREEYIRELSNGNLPLRVTEHTTQVDACRPLALALPYHGRISSSRVNWESVPQIVLERLEELQEHDLITRSEDEILLTRSGWDWYTSIMYYLLPMEEQRAINNIVKAALRDPRRDIEASGLEGFPFLSNNITALGV